MQISLKSQKLSPPFVQYLNYIFIIAHTYSNISTPAPVHTVAVYDEMTPGYKDQLGAYLHVKQV